MLKFNRRGVYSLSKGLKTFVRLFKSKVNIDDVRFREATYHDKESVLTLRHNVYRGLDYLADSYDFFLQDHNRECIVGELDGKVVTFGVMFFPDGGESLLGQAGRVHELYEGRGVFSALNQYFNKRALERGCKHRVALVDTLFNKHARTEKFKRSHTEIMSKLYYAGVVTNEIRQKISEITLLEHLTTIRDFSACDMQNTLKSSEICQAIFPDNRILLDCIPFRCMEENIELFKGRNTKFYSSITTCSYDVTGLLTAGSRFKCTNPPESYTIDIFGTCASDLENHLHFHLLKAMQHIPGEFCLQIFVEKGFIAKQLCKALIKLDIPKCDWYVGGGIGTKTIVERILT